MPDLFNLGRAATEHAPLPMALVEGSSHLVLYVNPAFCRLIGRLPKELVGKPFREMLPEQDKCAAVLDRVFLTGNPESRSTKVLKLVVMKALVRALS